MEIKGLKNTVPPWVAAALALALALGLWLAGSYGASALRRARADLKGAEKAAESSAAALDQVRELNELRARDIGNYKKALLDMAGSKKIAYEAGLSLQEEKRLLEKQLEIMTTWLDIREDSGKISLMRGDNSLKDLAFDTPLRAYGGAAAMPAALRVTSKERFANPQRGKVEQQGGKISWEPPQAGADPRSGALGEYVMFTDGPLILHGPPPNKALHVAYPHVCAGLTTAAARRLYESSYIGTKITYTRKKTSPAAKKGRS